MDFSNNDQLHLLFYPKNGILRTYLCANTTANAKIEELTEKKFKIESEYRKLEAEVGPIKYIAEFVYGEEADRDMLDRAVRWVIIMLVFVFDPLAICLILAGFQQMAWEKKKLGIEDEGSKFAMNIEVPDEPDQGIGQPVEAEFEKVEKEPEIEVRDEPGVIQAEEPEPTITKVEEIKPEPVVEQQQVDMSPIVSSIEQLQAMLADIEKRLNELK